MWVSESCRNHLVDKSVVCSIRRDINKQNCNHKLKVGNYLVSLRFFLHYDTSGLGKPHGTLCVP